MRILIICGAGYVSGKEKIMLSLLKGFAKDGDDVHCITSAWGNGQFESLLVSNGIAYSKIRLGFISKTLNWQAFKMTMDQLLYWPKLLYNYKKIISGFSPDVVIHTNFHHLFLLYPVVNSRKAIHVYHSHESIGNTNFYKKLFTAFQKKIRLFIGVSAYVSNKLNELGISDQKLKTIHNGLEIIEWQPKSVQTGSIFKIGIVGQVGAWKGHEDLILALAILRKDHPELQFRLCIFGDGTSLFIKELKDLVEKKQLNEFVEWKGFVNDIAQIYADLQLVCIPSRSEEPFATSALEAGLFGIPVIVTNRGGFPEIVKQGYNGFIVPVNSPGEITNHLAMLIADPGLALQIGSNHRKRVAEEFSNEHFISNWKNTLKELMS